MEVASLTAFLNHPERFYDSIHSLSASIWSAKPNQAHVALADMERAGVIKAVITQNIDGLHQLAGSSNVFELHGTLRSMTCIRCHAKVDSETVVPDFIRAGTLPVCPGCQGLLKPDIVLFEEMLPEDAWGKAEQFCSGCDVILVVGSSLEVIPASRLPLRAVEKGAHLISQQSHPDISRPLRGCRPAGGFGCHHPRISQAGFGIMVVSTKLRLQHYQRMIEIARDLASTLDLNELLGRIVQAAAELSKSQAASILLYDELRQELSFQVATNMEEPVIRGLSVPLEGSIAGWAAIHRQTAIVTDPHSDPRFFDQVEKTTRFPTQSLIALPLITKDKVVGVLEVLNKQVGQYSDEDRETLEALAAQAAVAIENTRLFQQSDLISVLVHEIRTPLTALDTAAYLLNRPEITPEQHRSLTATIHNETQRLNELATSFLRSCTPRVGQRGIQAFTS